MNLLVSLWLTFTVVATTVNSDCSIEKACCKTESINTVLDTAYILSSTLQELITTVKSKAGEVSEFRKRRDRDPPDCAAVQKLQQTKKSGIYQIWPETLEYPILVLCDLETEGGGWTVIQRRGRFLPPVENFYRSWKDYKYGFGNLLGEFWLGNMFIHTMTNDEPNRLRIELGDFAGHKRVAKYDSFYIGDERRKYTLHIEGYTGNAGDSLAIHNNMEFGTKDSGNTKCATAYKSGWWWNNCLQSNLNGLNLKGNHPSYFDGINWMGFKGEHYSLKKAEMKIRPRTF